MRSRAGRITACQLPIRWRAAPTSRCVPNITPSTFIRDFASRDPEMGGRDILELVIPKAKARGMKVIPEFMEPLFKYAGHGSAAAVKIPNMPQCLEIDRPRPLCRRAMHIQSGLSALVARHRRGACPQLRHRRHHVVQRAELAARPHDAGSGAGLLLRALPPRRRRSAASTSSASSIAFTQVWDFFQRARAGETFVDGTFIEFLRVLLRNPEVLLWERMWLERSKDLDRELYGIVKWCNPALSFGLNVWNRNHFNPIRKAQWSWEEQTDYADWVKPITYQHQAGEVFDKEMGFFGEHDSARLHQAGVRAGDVQASSA